MGFIDLWSLGELTDRKVSKFWNAKPSYWLKLAAYFLFLGGFPDDDSVSSFGRCYGLIHLVQP